MTVMKRMQQGEATFDNGTLRITFAGQQGETPPIAVTQPDGTSTEDLLRAAYGDIANGVRSGLWGEVECINRLRQMLHMLGGSDIRSLSDLYQVAVTSKQTLVEQRHLCLAGQCESAKVQAREFDEARKLAEGLEVERRRFAAELAVATARADALQERADSIGRLLPQEHSGLSLERALALLIDLYRDTQNAHLLLSGAHGVEPRSGQSRLPSRVAAVVTERNAAEEKRPGRKRGAKEK